MRVLGIKRIDFSGNEIILEIISDGGGGISLEINPMFFPAFAATIYKAVENFRNFSFSLNIKNYDEILFQDIYRNFILPYKIMGFEEDFRKKIREIVYFQVQNNFQNRVVVIQSIIDKFNLKSYLEIGVETGFSFFQIQTQKKFAVDPNFKIPWSFKDSENEKFFQMTSDEFFERFAEKVLPNEGVDIVFIDGLHTFEQSLKDVQNSLRFLSSNGFVIMHDCLPKNYPSSLPSLEDAVKHPEFDGEWSGDVYKTIIYLRTFFKDLFVAVLDCDHGVAIVKKGTPENMLNLTLDEVKSIDFFRLMERKEELLNLKSWEWFKNWLYSF